MDSNHKRSPFSTVNGNILKSLLSEASNEVEGGNPLAAVEKYKSVLDMITPEPGCPNPIRVPSDINPLIIKYALCWALIKCGDYSHLASAVEQLKELIKIGQDKILPALYYALAKAYRLLFRFNNAKDLLAQGKKVLCNIEDLKEFNWPGTCKRIRETIRQLLEENMDTLMRECGSYQSPDARCKYKKCLEIKGHIIPSDVIYFADPNFTPFLVLTCGEKCKVEFHVACWKEMKKDSDIIDKPKDMLGQPCPTIDCFTATKDRSVVVEVKLVDRNYTEGSPKVWTLPSGPIKKPTAITPKKKAKPEKTDKCEEKVVTVSPMDKNKLKKKDKKNSPELSPPGAPGQDIKSYSNPNEAAFEEELALKADLLEKLRRYKFGFKNADIMNPMEVHFGNDHVRKLASHGNFLDSVSPGDAEAAKKEFILSMFYELIKKDGVQNITDINAVKDKMLDKIDVFDANTITDMWQLLLESRRFCAIGDKIGTSEDIPLMYEAAQTEIVESTSEVVLGRVVKPRFTRSQPEEVNVPNTFQLFPVSPSVPPILNTDTAINNFANDPSSTWEQRPGFKQIRQPHHGLITPDLGSVSCDKNSNSDLDLRDFNAFSAYNKLNANSPIKNIVRNEHKNLVHSISSEDALNDNLDVRRNENYSLGSAFDNPTMNSLKNGDVGGSVGGIPFSDKIDLSEICHFYMGPRWVNEEDHIMLQKDREIKQLKETLKRYQHIEQNLLHAQMELTRSLEKNQTEIESLKLTIKKYESLLDEKNKHWEDASMRISSTEQDLLHGQMRLLDTWKQHEDFIIRTINQKYTERLKVVNHLKKFMCENDRKKIEDDVRILESSRSFQEISKRTEEFYNQAKERVLLRVPHFYLPEHTVDANIGASIIEQALELMPQANNVDRSFEGFYHQQPSPAYHLQSQPLVRSQAPPLMSIAVSRPMSIDTPPPIRNQPTLPQAGLSQSSSRSSTPQPLQPLQPPSSDQSGIAQFGLRTTPSDAPNLAPKPFAVVGTGNGTGVGAGTGTGAAPGAGTKPKAPVVAPAIVQTKILPPSKLPSSEKASVPFPIEPMRPKFSNFSELTEEMSFLFPAVARQDLVKALRQIKAGRPNKTLNGMSQQKIADKLEILLASKEFKRPSHVGLEKFSSAAWGAASNTSNNWQGSDDTDCAICSLPMDENEKYVLVCKHVFHESCINEWGKRNAECPLCRQFFKTDRSYPELRSATN